MRDDDGRAALADEIERHISAEEAILKEYHVLVDQLPEGPIGILVNQITTEEEMHHFLLTTLVAWLRSDPQAGGDGRLAGVDRRGISERARLLQDHEEATIDACSALQERVGGDEGCLVSALLDVLILDSRKHHRLLAVLDTIASDSSA